MSPTPDVERIASRQTWDEFESFTDRAFQSLGFQTTRNLRLKKPRMQIDLLASRNGTTFVIDCKHWKRTAGKGSMLRVAKKQLSRADRMAENGVFGRLVPMILTWRDEAIFVLENGVPVVPIHRLTDFVLNWDRADSHVLVLKSEVQQKILTGSG